MSYYRDDENNYRKVIKKEILLPNFIYRNNKVYWNFKENVKINENGKTKYIKNLELGNIPLDGEINILKHLIKCKINQKNLTTGLSVDIEYLEDEKIKVRQIAKIARFIEATLLDIDLNYDEYEKEELFYDSNNEDKEKTDIIYLSDDDGW